MVPHPLSRVQLPKVEGLFLAPLVWRTEGPSTNWKPSTLGLGHTLAALLSSAGVPLPRWQHKQTPVSWA